MKKIVLFLIAVFALASCSTFVPLQKATYATFLDYRPYNSEGFFLSPEPYVGECEFIGELFIEVLPEQKAIKDGAYDSYDALSYYGGKWYGFERLSYAEILQTAVVRAVSMGANGISSLKIEKHNGTRPFYTVTGLCIKK